MGQIVILAGIAFCLIAVVLELHQIYTVLGEIRDKMK